MTVNRSLIAHSTDHDQDRLKHYTFDRKPYVTTLLRFATITWQLLQLLQETAQHKNDGMLWELSASL